MGKSSSKLHKRDRIQIYKRVTLDEIKRKYETINAVKKSEIRYILNSCPLSCNFHVFCYSHYKLKIEILNKEISGKNRIMLSILIKFDIYNEESICKLAILGLDQRQYTALFL